MYLYIVLAGGLLLTMMLSYGIKQKNINNISAIEYVTAAVVFLALMFWFMGYTGVLASGYHFVDDHEVYTIRRGLKDYGYWSTLTRRLSNDLKIRFRFTYNVIRVTECYFFGDNFVLWHGFQTFMAAAGLFLSYVFARQMKCTVWGAYIFAIMIYIGGGQSAVWWRLGPQENLGVILFMLTLLSLHIYLQKDRLSHLILSLILTIFLGGIKESFLLLLPLLPVWIVYWEFNLNGHDVSWQNIRAILKKRWIYSLVTYIVFLIDMAIILMYVGTNQIEYAGIDGLYGILDYIRGIWNIVRGRLSIYVITTMIGILFLFVPVCISWIRKQRDLFFGFVRYMIIPVLIFVYFLGVQLILYAKSGMIERYLIPATIAFAYFWLIDVNGYAKIHTRFMKGYYVFVTFMALALIMVGGGRNDEVQAYAYAESGKNTTAMLSRVAEYSVENPNIVVCIDYEQDVSASRYLQEKYEIKSVYNLFFSPREGNIVHDGYLLDEDEKPMITLEEAHMFIGYPYEIVSVMEESGIQVDDFESYMYGDYVLYIKKR